MEEDKKIKVLENLNRKLSLENEKLKLQLEEMTSYLDAMSSQTKETLDNLNFSKSEFESLIKQARDIISDYKIQKEMYDFLTK